MKPLVVFVLVALVGTVASRASATPQGSAFSYQGKLTKSNASSSGSHNFEFKLYDALTGGTQIGTTQTVNGVTVTNGLFTLTLDFGSSAFSGDARWLEISVQGPGDGSFTLLTPRQQLSPVPYAIRALNGSGGLTLPFSGSVSNPGASAIAVTNTGNFGFGVDGVGTFAGGIFTGTGGGSSGVSGVGQSYGVFGETQGNAGVLGRYGFLDPQVVTGSGVYGYSSSSSIQSGAVRGIGTAGRGVYGTGGDAGVYGDGPSWGVYGTSTGNSRAGVFGQTSIDNTSGVLGRSETSGFNAQAVFGYASANAVGVKGISEGNDGMVAQSNAANRSGIWAFSTHANGIGGAFANFGGGVALKADGLAQVNTLQILGSDLAESFPVSDPLEPGTVLEIVGDAEGTLRECRGAYNPRVAGVVSGANGLPAGVILEGHSFDKQGKVAVAMSGRVWVKCDATAAPIRVGDLLTTANRPGHAMRAVGGSRVTGAIIGKAMTSLETGTGLVLALVSLQ